MAKRKGPPAPEPETLDDEEIEGADLNEGAESALKDFENYFIETLGDLDFELKLYRCEQSGKRVRRTFLERLVNAIPREDDIGETYGAGWYAVRGVHPKNGKLVAREIHIDRIWDARKKQKDMEKAAEERALLGGGGAVGPPAPVLDPLALVERVIGMIRPILDSTASKKTEPAQMIDAMMEMGLTQFRRMNRFYDSMQGEIQKTRIGKSEPVAKETDGTGEIVREVIGLIKLFGTQLLSGGGDGSKIRSFLEKDERFRELVDDDQALSAVYTAAISDPDIGEGKIRKLFTSLGIELPEPMAAGGVED